MKYLLFVLWVLHSICFLSNFEADLESFKFLYCSTKRNKGRLASSVDKGYTVHMLFKLREWRNKYFWNK